jgi:hypothetical protein
MGVFRVFGRLSARAWDGNAQAEPGRRRGPRVVHNFVSEFVVCDNLSLFRDGGTIAIVKEVAGVMA